MEDHKEFATHPLPETRSCPSYGKETAAEGILTGGPLLSCQNDPTFEPSPIAVTSTLS